jgi:nucleoredoxin
MRTFFIAALLLIGAWIYFLGSPGSMNGTTDVAQLLQGKLIGADGNPVTLVSSGPSAVQYYALYYSAQWCGPCHAFTPVLADWYRKFKPAHPNFELVFVSEDHSEKAMLDYQKEMDMPWPAVRYTELKHDGLFKGSGIEMFAGRGIPDLVLVDAQGKVLSDSFGWMGSYIGPEHVMADAETMVR